MTPRISSARASGAGALLLAAAMLAAVGVLGLAGAPAARAATDPFYLDLMRDGIQAYDRGDYATAAKQLRLACFGLLDDPQPLAGCLTRLGLAQAAAGNGDAFRETFRRIVEVETRFGAYTKTDLPPAVRAAFEERALAAVPASTLDAIPVWKALLGRKLEAQLARLPPRERRRQLEERLAKEPRSITWNVMLVDLDLAEGKNAPALTRAEATAVLAPRDARVLCARGLARAAGNRCGEAVADLETCSAAAAAGGTGLAGDGPRLATALLGCRVELGQWRQAEEQVRGLPPDLRKDRKIAALMQQVAKHPSAPAGAGAAGAGATAKSATPTTGATGSRPSTGSPSGTGPTSTTGATHAAGSTGPPSSTSSAGSTPPTRAAGSTAAGEPLRPAAGTGSSTGTAGQGQTAAKPPPPAAGGQGAAQPSSTTAAGSGAAATRGGAAPAPAGGPRGSATAAAGPPPLPRPLAPLSTAERESMARSERLLAATTIPDLREALRLARELADAHPDSKEAQYLAGAAAYRNSRWPEAAAYFRRGGPPGDDHPELLFYMAVAFYEVGDQPGAASALKRSLPNLQKTPFVESYVKRILGQ
jgi:predicted Zn-dependent protease